LRALLHFYTTIKPLGERPKGFQGSGSDKTTHPLSVIDYLDIRQTRKFTEARVFTLCQGLTPAIAGCTSFTAFSRWLLPQFLPRFAVARHRQKFRSQSPWTVDLFTRFARSKSALADSAITGVKPWHFRWRYSSNSRRALAAPTPLSRGRFKCFSSAWPRLNGSLCSFHLHRWRAALHEIFCFLFAFSKTLIALSRISKRRIFSWEKISLFSLGHSKFAPNKSLIWIRFKPKGTARDIWVFKQRGNVMWCLIKDLLKLGLKPIRKKDENKI
jgi:hypothetical protein